MKIERRTSQKFVYPLKSIVVGLSNIHYWGHNTDWWGHRGRQFQHTTQKTNNIWLLIKFILNTTLVYYSLSPSIRKKSF